MTVLLSRARAGDAGARGQLFPAIYDELRRLADHYMDRQQARHTLQPTALVHEAWVKLVDVDAARVAGRQFARRPQFLVTDYWRRCRTRRGRTTGEGSWNRDATKKPLILKENQRV